jgi:FAD:protein FMN transferase
MNPRRFHPIKAAWVLLVLALFAVYTTRRDRPASVVRWSGPTMGSTYSVQVADRGMTSARLAELRGEVEALLERINAETSTWLPDSAISRFNASASMQPFEVSPEFVEVARLALDVSRASAGIFDITFSPLFDLWGFGRGGTKRVPSDTEIAQALTICGCRNLEIVSSNRIRKAVPQLQISFNAVMPGHAAERIVQHLLSRGCTNVYADVGGETVVRGLNPQGQPWRIGIEAPVFDAPPGEDLAAVVHLSDRALATSGDYRNYFTNALGEVFTHIFDTRTCRPTTSRVASVSVVATNGGLADALATTLFAMGPEQGLPWLTNFPGTEAFFLVREGRTLREHSSSGFAAYLAAPTP